MAQAGAKASSTAAKYLARRRHEIITRILRVDHAGELGADRIYAGQMAVLNARKFENVLPIKTKASSEPSTNKDGKTAVELIQEMWDQEKVHLERMELLALKHRIPKSLLTPFWSIGGFALGAGSALLGKEAAMACTVAVEKVITEHYESQLRQLLSIMEATRSIGGEFSEFKSQESTSINLEHKQEEEELRELVKWISQFRDDEQHHHDVGLENDAQKAPAYQALSATIEGVCRLAIQIAQRI